MIFNLLLLGIAHVVGIGSPICDYVGFVEESVVSEMNLVKGKTQVIEKNSFEKILSGIANPEPLLEGSVLSTIRALAIRGCSCSLIGAIGTDTLGEMIPEQLSRENIHPLLTKSLGATSQTLHLITPDGVSTWVTCKETSSHHDPLIQEGDLIGADLIYSSCSLLEYETSLEQAFSLAKETEITLCLDLASPSLASVYRERIFALLKDYVDIVFATEQEARALTGLSPEKSASFLKNYCRIAVVKLEAGGCFVDSSDGSFYTPTSLPPTSKKEPFASSFLHGYLQGFPLEQCASLGMKPPLPPCR